VSSVLLYHLSHYLQFLLVVVMDLVEIDLLRMKRDSFLLFVIDCLFSIGTAGGSSKVFPPFIGLLRWCVDRRSTWRRWLGLQAELRDFLFNLCEVIFSGVVLLFKQFHLGLELAFSDVEHVAHFFIPDVVSALISPLFFHF
jgi:hypothetical protein